MGLVRGPLAAFFVFLGLPASSSAGASLAPDEMSPSSAPPRRDRLPVGRAGCVTTEPVGSGSSLTPCLSSVLCGVTFQCPHLSSIRLQQGRQDLNLQPAVLETAALPVELRPFMDNTAGTLLAGQSLRDSHNSRAPRSADQKPTDSARNWENPEVRVYIGPGLCC